MKRVIIILGVICILVYSLGCLDSRSDWEKFWDVVFEDDPSLCNPIVDLDIEYYCKALIEKNSELCDKITNVSIRDKCYDAIIYDAIIYHKYKTVDVELLCSKTSTRIDHSPLTLPNESEYYLTNREHCYRDMVSFSLSNKTEMCNEFNYKLLREECYITIAIRRENQTLCDMIDDFEDNLYCIALASRNTSLCEEIENQTWKDYCYQNLAILTEDIDLCNNIQTEEIRKLCLRDKDITK